MSADRRPPGDALRHRWDAIWPALGFGPPPEAVFRDLLARYSEPHRAYHTLRHLEECFARLAPARPLCARPAEVELALWFHDAIYDTQSARNEEMSAEWAERVLDDLRAPDEVTRRVRELVLSTKHHATPTSPDACVLVDVDLSILGAEADRFDEYEHQVRQEFAWVPEPAFRQARAKVLNEFLARSSIYATEFFRQRLESRARDNLQRSLARLGA